MSDFDDQTIMLTCISSSILLIYEGKPLFEFKMFFIYNFSEEEEGWDEGEKSAVILLGYK